MLHNDQGSLRYYHKDPSMNSWNDVNDNGINTGNLKLYNNINIIIIIYKH